MISSASSIQHWYRYSFCTSAVLGPSAKIRFLCHPPLPVAARGTTNPRPGVVCGTKVVGKSHVRALRRCLPAARRLGLYVPVGAKRGADGLLCFLLNFGLGLFLGGVLGECGCAEKKSGRGHISVDFQKKRAVATFRISPPKTSRALPSATPLPPGSGRHPLAGADSTNHSLHFASACSPPPPLPPRRRQRP